MRGASAWLRRGAFVLALVLTVTAIGSDGGPDRDARAQAGSPPLTVQPQLGPGLGAVLLGSAPHGVTGDPAEAWAYRSDAPLPPTSVDGRLLDDAGFMLLRYTSAEGWRGVETPVDENGQPYRGIPVETASGRVTPRGAMLLVTNDGSRPEGQRRVVVARDPGGRARALPAPGNDVILPRDGSVPPEALTPSVVAAVDEPGRTTGFLAIEGRTPQTGVARWDGSAWQREPVCVIRDAADTPPSGCSAGETLTSPTLAAVAIAASGGRAWMLARVQDRGLVLLERTGDGGVVRWRTRDLGLPVLEDAATPAAGVADVAPLATPFAATATDDGIWLDGTFQQRGTSYDVTLFFDGTSAMTWCDVAELCDHELRAVFSATSQRSYAWGRPGAGSRVITAAGRAGESRTQTRSDFLRLDGTAFVRHFSFTNPGASAAFGAADEGWIGGARIAREAWSAPMANWPLPVRRPLTAVAAAPGSQVGEIGAGALAVGLDGSVLRYTPGQGWDAEPLLGSGGVAHPSLRGVAWPSDEFAFAVGDGGAMWRWRRVTGLWEPDPGAPFDFVGHMTGIAFQPANANRGYAVGRAGLLLRYDKTWTQETLPEQVRTSGPLGGPADLMSVGFAGSQAIVAAWRSVLVNDGAGWRVDEGAQALLDRAGGAVYAVAGLPDGGAVVAGNQVVLIRDHAGGAWRYADQALPGQTATAVGAFREGDRVRALAAVSRAGWPRQEQYELAPTDPGAPPPRPPAFTVPTEGVLLRETATGWRDEQRSAFVAPGSDGARSRDPILALLAGPSGAGWTVGGKSGQVEVQGSLQFFPQAQTAAAARYSPTGPEPAPVQRPAAPALPAGPARLAVGGHAQCDQPCAGLHQLDLMPERTLAQAGSQAAAMAAQPNGPRALLYTGGRIPPLAEGRDPEPEAEARRLAQLLSTGGALPVLAAVAPGNAGAGTTGAFQSAFAGAAAPFGTAAAVSGTAPVELGLAPAPGRARTHYAVDIQTTGGQVRVIVIDNSRGSLAAGNPHQNPQEDQLPWLQATLASARSRGLPAVVMGNLSLNSRDDGAAADADAVADLLRAEGVSAYLFDSPSVQRSLTVPAGAPDAIPAFGSGSLGYRASSDDQDFGGPGLLLLEVDAARRDPGTNRAPVAVRLIPVIEDLALESVDGRVLNRSQPALFRGLGRRPRSGDLVAAGSAGSDPYISLPAASCAVTGCAGRLDPEVRFTSSDPDIANFVRQDPASDNPRKPAVDAATDKPIPDERSGLLCAFNAGTTTVTIESGGLAYSTTVTVRDGSVLRPCGTVPLAPIRFPPADTPPDVTSPPPPPPDSPPEDPLPVIPPPPPPPPEERPPVREEPKPRRPPRVAEPYRPPPPAPPPPLPVLVPLTSPPVPRPIPPTGTSPVSSTTSVVQPAAKVQKEREEEAAPEHQSAAVRYDAGQRQLVASLVIALVSAAALAAVGLQRAPGRRDRGQELAHSYVRNSPRRHRRSW